MARKVESSVSLPEFSNVGYKGPYFETKRELESKAFTSTPRTVSSNTIEFSDEETENKTDNEKKSTIKSPRGKYQVFLYLFNICYCYLAEKLGKK